MILKSEKEVSMMTIKKKFVYPYRSYGIGLSPKKQWKYEIHLYLFINYYEKSSQ